MGFTRIHLDYSNPNYIRDEFNNAADSLQDKQFFVVNDTPALNDLQDGQIMVYSTGTVNKLIWRRNQEIYSVNGSCVTIRR